MNLSLVHLSSFVNPISTWRGLQNALKTQQIISQKHSVPIRIEKQEPQRFNAPISNIKYFKPNHQHSTHAQQRCWGDSPLLRLLLLFFLYVQNSSLGFFLLHTFILTFPSFYAAFRIIVWTSTFSYKCALALLLCVFIFCAAS